MQEFSSTLEIQTDGIETAFRRQTNYAIDNCRETKQEEYRPADSEKVAHMQKNKLENSFISTNK